MLHADDRELGGKAVRQALPAQSHRKKLVLVGSVRGTLEDGRIGGQAFACRSLMASRLASEYDVRAIDSSIRSISVNRGLMRAPSAAFRLAQFSWQLLAHRPFACLLFASHGLSFLEKGLMALLADALGVRVLLMPRSGHLQAQVERSKAFAAFTRHVLKNASFTICQSAWWQQFFSDITSGRGRFRVVENWLPEQAFAPADADVSCSRGPEFVVGYFNRIEEAKGIFDFIEAVRLASSRVSNLRALIYGDGSCVHQVQARIDAMGLSSLIELRGWLGDDDKFDRLRRLDAYLFTSHVEGFPNSLLEVLAMKVPVISVRVGAVPDVIEHGTTGLLADVKDVEGLAANLELLAADHALRGRLAQAAYRRVRSNNTLEQAVRSIEEALA